MVDMGNDRKVAYSREVVAWVHVYSPHNLALTISDGGEHFKGGVAVRQGTCFFPVSEVRPGRQGLPVLVVLP